jgi:hydroxyacylglutathione hydrolase
VRAKAEFEENHIKVRSILKPQTCEQITRNLTLKQKTILVCSSGNRSSLGTSILAQKGFKKLVNVPAE